MKVSTQKFFKAREFAAASGVRPCAYSEEAPNANYWERGRPARK